MDSAFTLSIDWLAFTVLASRPEETTTVLGGGWSEAEGGCPRLSAFLDQVGGLHGVGKLGTNSPHRPK